MVGPHVSCFGFRFGAENISKTSVRMLAKRKSLMAIASWPWRRGVGPRSQSPLYLSYPSGGSESRARRCDSRSRAFFLLMAAIFRQGAPGTTSDEGGE